ncbi:MAG: ribonuclease D [Candidatus Xenolissoclinum pacificiensis L6]|uniref:Ribonuclease D n=1 Tax=Candidatus Xenolissoclinum pacificiensis L6 TaxID=1401685 RepID=W2V106_9RICK|nr:MAG: ribonuclease D [Candidatus Xenolissoclinum pacificiensis L6]
MYSTKLPYDYSLELNDLSDSFVTGKSVAVDTETMGLNYFRDRLCLVQLCTDTGNNFLVKFDDKNYQATRLKELMVNPNILKIFHYARFDMVMIKMYLGVIPHPVYCTKIASRLSRTYTDSHSLKALCYELLNVKLNKAQQSSNWSNNVLSAEQIKYAISDVMYLHKLKEKLDIILEENGRTELARSCFQFLKSRILLDITGWADEDIFSHSSRKDFT